MRSYSTLTAMVLHVLALNLALTQALPSYAQVPGQKIAARDILLPEAVLNLIDAETVVVGWIDLESIEPAAVAQFMSDIEGSIPEEEVERIGAIQQALVQLKVQRMYVLGDVASLLSGPPRIVLPSENASAVALFMESVFGDSVYRFSQVNGAAIGQPKGTALPSAEKEASPELMAAIMACTGKHGLAVATPPYVTITAKTLFKSRQDVAQIAKASQILTSLKWIALSGNLPPNQAELRIETDSETAAIALCDFLQSTTEPLGERGPLLQLTPNKSSAVMKIKSTDDARDKLLAARDLFELGSTNIMNSMKQIGLALHNYADVHKSFPPQCLVAADGQRLLSWRVLILPYLDQSALYDQFHLDEPWDSPHNLKLAETIPAPYLTQRNAEGGPQKTQMLAVLTKDSAFGRPGKPLYFTDILDGTVNTIWFVEAPQDQAVVWTKPDDLVVDEAAPGKVMMPAGARGIHAAVTDGSVHFLDREKATDAFLRAVLTVDGGETVEW
ncbi:MAG: DUF1559 domain-containing protein [Pirellulaceae bacterium]